MRILHVDSGRQMRGGQFQVLFLIEGLSARGHQNTLLAPAASPLFAEALKRGIDARPLGLASLWRLSRRVGLTHAHDAHSHSLAAVFARSPLVVARRVAFDVRHGRLSKWKYGRAAQFIAVSEYVKSKLTAAGVEPSRITVIYDAVPAMPPRNRTEIVLAPATDDPMKGSRLLRQAGALGGFEPVFSNHLATDLERAAVFVYISHNEGLGSAALLAMAAGVPVVASRVGGLPEIVRDGETGVLVENDPGAVAAAVKQVLANSALAARLGAAGRRFVIEHFSVSKLAEKTELVYERVRR